ncbi:hypothetical protein [Microtetraspora malaysiensis]|uniref:hypothetical protein n=1 Tax=Microtetraspora malaysiensis TaxID=161358 RepID=UPI000B181343|nr:hypothetical protein [Microtetraspora malaysiensis]
MLRAAVDTGKFGGLRRIRVVQNKPRFTHGTTAPGHPTAFDIEVPLNGDRCAAAGGCSGAP